MKTTIASALLVVVASTHAIAEEDQQATEEPAHATVAPPSDDTPTPVERGPALAPPSETPPGSPTTALPSKPAPTGSFQVGAGYNSDDGFVFGARVAQDDLFRTGQRLSLSAELSEIRQRFSIVHVVPDVLGLELRSELFSDRRDLGSFTREMTGGDFTLAKQLTRATRIYGGYRIAHVEVEPDVIATPRIVDPAADVRLGDGVLATARAGLVYDTRDVPLLPLRGTRLELFGERASRSLGSDFDFDRVGGIVEHARGLGPLTLRLSGSATYLHARDPGGVPLAFRLHHLGHQDLRGYELGSIGTVGGNVQALGRAELELPIWKRAGLSIAGFYDMGMQQNTDAAWGDTDVLWRRSAGVSLIWRSPIGPLRLDLAYPLDGHGERQWLINVGGGF